MAGLPVEGSSDALGARLLLLTRRAPGLVAMVLMAVAGLGVSIYLTTIHYQGVAPVCNNNGVINCARVTSSGNSVLFGTGIPITIPGMLWFLVSGALALVALQAIWRDRREPARLRQAHLLWGVAGMIFVLYLVYAEIVLLHSLCEWCTVVHLLTFATLLIALYRWQQRDLPTPTLGLARPNMAKRVASVPAATNGGKARQVAATTTATSSRQPVGTSARRPTGASGRSGRRGRR